MSSVQSPRSRESGQGLVEFGCLLVVLLFVSVAIFSICGFISAFLAGEPMAILVAIVLFIGALIWRCCRRAN